MQILSDIHHLSYLLIKKNPEVVVLIPPKLEIVISQDFVDRTATNQYDAFLQHVYLQIITGRQHTVLSANKSLQCMSLL